MITCRKTLWCRAVWLLLVVFAVSVGRVEAQPAGAPPHTLRVEYTDTPLGLDVQRPRFSWQLGDLRRGAHQTAYRIRVATHPDVLKQDEDLVWDSGKVEHDRSVHVPYDGLPLRSRTRYYWTVQVWDQEGRPTGYSPPAWWETGLLQPDDWEGAWIGYEADRDTVDAWTWGHWIWHPAVDAANRPIYFRRTFDLPDKPIAEAVLKATADDTLRFWLNHSFVGRGTAWQKEAAYEVTRRLKPGRNELAAVATRTAPDGDAGLLLGLRIVFTDGTVMTIQTDDAWQTTDRYAPGREGLNTLDEGWTAARMVAPYGEGPWGRGLEPAYWPPRSIQVRHAFTLAKPVARARAYVTGLGSYRMRLNGRRVGEDVLTPGWTDYHTRVQYQTYDVTDHLRAGPNAVGALLGSAWWSGGLGWDEVTEVYDDGPLRFRLMLVIDYTDGTTETITTGPDWKAHASPIRFDNLYDGEVYDARLEQPGWDRPGFDDHAWHAVRLLDEDALLVAQYQPTIRVTETLAPVSLAEVGPGVFVADFGQNFAGWVRLRVHGGRPGQRIRLRFAELLQDDGHLYTSNLRTARQTDVYIARGDAEEDWEPHFTYHGFRYVEITGYPGTPTPDDLAGRVVHTDAPATGHFNSSNDLLNRIFRNIAWGQRSNMHSVLTDCPQRDERLSWTGDLQNFGPTALYNRSMARFFTKWMQDVRDSQQPSGHVVDVNPLIAWETRSAKPGYGDAVVVVPWLLYLYYGDTRVLEENYAVMKDWVEYMRGRAEDDIYVWSNNSRTWFGYGDWTALDRSPTRPFGSLFYFYSTHLLAETAAVLGYEQDAATYRALRERIAAAYQRTYYEPDAQHYEGRTQAANVMPVALGITPPHLTEALMAQVVADIERRGMHLTTGFPATARLLPALSDHGHHEVAYALAAQTTFPSWGYMVRQGATTIWELWAGDQRGPQMNSRNHPALGSVGAWFYGYLAGIRPTPTGPGFKHTHIAPHPAGDLASAEATLQTLYGVVESRWTRSDDRFRLTVAVPPNTTATVRLPRFSAEPPSVREGHRVLMTRGQVTGTAPGVIDIKLAEDAVVLDVTAGTYAFTLTTR